MSSAVVLFYVACSVVMAQAPSPEALAARRAEYASIAKNIVPGLADGRPAPEAAQEPAIAEARERWRVMTLEAAESGDRRLKALAKEAGAAHARLLDVADANDDALVFALLGTILVPNPLTVGHLMREGAKESDRTNRYEAAVQRRRAAMFLLPEVARELAGPVSKDPLVIDFDENWFGPQGTPDRLNLTNKWGHDLTCVTIQVDVRGRSGPWVRNIHFVEAWPKGAKLWADYLSNDPRRVEALSGTTAVEVQDVTVSMWCMELQAEMALHYPDADRKDDWFRQLDANLKVSLDYVAAPFFESGPCIGITLQGVGSLPKSRITLACHYAEQGDVLLHYVAKAWEGDSRVSVQSQGSLHAQPDSVDVTIETDGVAKPVVRKATISSSR
jgi:hypothetical protein